MMTVEKVLTVVVSKIAMTAGVMMADCLLASWLPSTQNSKQNIMNYLNY